MSNLPFSTITYCGHSAVLLQTKGPIPYTLAIDPWLSGNPTCPPHLVNPERLDCIVLTHGHSDHAGDAVRLGKHCGSHLVATYELAMLLIDEGYPEDKVTPMNKGGTVTVGGRYHVSLTHALHSSSYEGSEGPRYAGEACGVVIRDGSNSFYHAGDTALFSDMSFIKATYAPTWAFIPCGDCFTMGPVEAAQAAALIGAKKSIPIHHSTFPLLTGDPNAFIAECKSRGLEAAVMEPGQSVAL